MSRGCRERGLAIPTCITARAQRTCRGFYWDHQLAVSFEVGGGENVPRIPGACATRNIAYLVRGPWGVLQYITVDWRSILVLIGSAIQYVTYSDPSSTLKNHAIDQFHKSKNAPSCSISHNAPFRTEMYTALTAGIWLPFWAVQRDCHAVALQNGGNSHTPLTDAQPSRLGCVAVYDNVCVDFTNVFTGVTLDSFA